MNNDNVVATHPRTVVQYMMKCEKTTKIYSVRKLNTLIYIYIRIPYIIQGVYKVSLQLKTIITK